MGGGYLPNQNEIFYQNKQAQEAQEAQKAEEAAEADETTSHVMIATNSLTKNQARLRLRSISPINLEVIYKSYVLI